jgi:hypothetical protein
MGLAGPRPPSALTFADCNNRQKHAQGAQVVFLSGERLNDREHLEPIGMMQPAEAEEHFDAEPGTCRVAMADMKQRRAAKIAALRMARIGRPGSCSVQILSTLLVSRFGNVLPHTGAAEGRNLTP